MHMKTDIPTLVIMCGLPGSGKTTLARKLAQEMPAIRLSPDEWKASLGIDYYDEVMRVRLERQLLRLAWELLGLGQDVILENGFWTRPEREELRTAARAKGYRVELRFLDVPFEELARRIAERNAKAEHGAVPIERQKLEQYSKVFQAPTGEELAFYDEPSRPSQ
jgi:predicted kinase